MCEYTATEEDWVDWGGYSFNWQIFLEYLGVEEGVWKCPHDKLENEDYCAFHTENPEEVNQSERLKEALNSDEHRRRQFLGATFVSISLGGIKVPSIDEGPCAVFVGSTFEDGAYFRDADFNGYAYFRDADFKKGANFIELDLTETDFRDATLHRANFERAILSRATLIDADLRGAHLSGAVMTDARINDGTKLLSPPVNDLPLRAYVPAELLKLIPRVEPSVPVCGYDAAFTPPESSEEDEDDEETDAENEEEAEADVEEPSHYPEESKDDAKSVYRAIERLASMNPRPRLQSRAFVRRQDIQRKQYREDGNDSKNGYPERFLDLFRSFRAGLARAIMLHGESPWRLVGVGALIILAFGLAYPIGGVLTADGWLMPVEPDGELAKPLTYTWGWETLGNLKESLYFSTLTFTTLGFGDFQPEGFGQVLTMLNTGLGALTVALLVWVLGRRAAR